MKRRRARKSKPSYFVIRLIGLASGEPTDIDGHYITYYNPDEKEGRGFLRTTPSKLDALTFPDAAHAFEYWRQQSRTQPLRPDGKPNRPLTAFTVQVEPYRG